MTIFIIVFSEKNILIVKNKKDWHYLRSLFYIFSCIFIQDQLYEQERMTQGEH